MKTVLIVLELLKTLETWAGVLMAVIIASRVVLNNGTSVEYAYNF